MTVSFQRTLVRFSAALMLGAALMLSAATGSAAEPVAVSESPAKPVDATPVAPSKKKKSAIGLELSAGLRALHRSFKYHDTPAQLYPDAGYPSPNNFLLPLGPSVFLRADFFPLVWVSPGVGSYLGITGGYEQGFGTTSIFAENTPDQARLTTHFHEYDLGLRARLPIDLHELGLVAAYGQQTFSVLGDERYQLVPDVTYQYVRLTADARFRFDELSVGFHIGTRLVSDTGALKTDWFPNARARVFEAGIFAGYRLSPQLDVLFGVDLLRYAFDFNPIPTAADPRAKVIAGGAVDQYTSGWLGLRWTINGSSSSD